MAATAATLPMPLHEERQIAEESNWYVRHKEQESHIRGMHQSVICQAGGEGPVFNE